MFAGCHSLKTVEINKLNTSSLITMAHMFENCYSLRSINLSNFSFNLTQNIEYLFANDNKLVYVNLINADDSKIKKMDNIFQGTLENMVFCINQTLSSNIYRIISRKGCSAIDCSGNWTQSRKLIIESTGQCVNECPAKTIFFYDYKCYYRCPNFTFPDDFVFEGSKESVRKQIGMAVPAQGAKIIFEAVLKTFAGVEYPSAESRLS